MTGKEIVDSYFAKLEADTLTPAERKRFQTLMSANMVLSSNEELYALIEEAERTGQVLQLVHPIPIDQGYSEPSGVRLVKLV